MPSELTARTQSEWATLIRVERARLDLKQVEVANLAGIDQGTVSKAESGIGSEDTYASIASALNIELPGRGQ